MKKVVNKPLPRFYPQKLLTIGDYLRTKRLDSGLRQKDIAGQLNACEATIKNWEKNYTKPQPHHIPLICDFLGYCPLTEPPVQHFGHQLRNYRTCTLGKTIFELATDIGIDEGTLNEIEKTNIIRYTHVLNAVNRFLEKAGWSNTANRPPDFSPKRIKCRKSPKFYTPVTLPETLGEHIALRRRQLKLTQAEVMLRIEVISASTYRSWERYGVQPQIKYYPKIMDFLGYCPVQYPKSERQRLKLMRENLGLSYRQVDTLLSLPVGCTYRAESSTYLNPRIAEKLWEYYTNHQSD